ncbi:ABC transporter permease [Arsenicicoccus dermatophilus]|uniref:ABC transporter permease n=1 Tax=Arsenicicoccus dermatophilus TaxID=1076331 RepID=UPI003916F7A7
MLRASWKSLLARKLRLLMSAFAIVLGVSFVSGSLIFTDMMSTAFNGIMSGTVADINVQTTDGDPDSMSTAMRGEITQAQIDTIAKVDGVESAQGVTTVMDAFLIGKNGKVIGGQGAPSIGGNVVTAPAYGHQPGMVVKSGHLPGPGEVLIDPTSLDRSGYRIGDTITVASSGAQPSLKARIAGTVLWGSKESTAGATYAMFDARTTQRQWTGGRNAYQMAWVTVREGQDVDVVARRVKEVAPAGFLAVTGPDLAKKSEDAVAQGLGFISTFLLVFAAISLIVGSFLIVNTFSILVAQRSRELALLRAMGASRGQVRGSVLFEAFVVGLVGSTIGLVLGLAIAKGIAAIFGTLGLDMGAVTPTLSPRAIVASYVVGMLVTMLAAYLPARKASTVPPVAAMSGAATTGAQDLGRRLVIGLGMTAVGLAMLLTGLFWDGAPQPMWWIGAGALLTLLGVSFSSPVLGKPVLWALGRGYRAVFGQVGALAELNAIRNPRRTAATASALMIGLTLVTAMSVLGDSAKASTRSAVEEGLRGDFVYANPTYQPFATAIGDQVAKVDGVAAVHRFRRVPVELGGERAMLGAIGAQDFDKILAGTVVAGSLSDFQDGTAIVARKTAEEKGWKVGQTLDYRAGRTPVPVRIVALSEHPKGTRGGVVTTLQTLVRAGLPAVDSQVNVDLAAGADKAATRDRLEAIVKDLPMVSLQDQQEFADARAGSIDQLLAMIYGLLGLAIVIAVLGIVNTLALSVIERTREIGLLRAIGLGRGQLRRMIRLESVGIALLGSVLGLGMGLLFGTAVVQALVDDGLSLHVPWLQLVTFLLVAAVVGVVAALWPAHRASRMDVLRAIQTE